MANEQDTARLVEGNESSLQEGDEIAVGTAVSYEMGVDAKTGRTKAIRVDLV